MDVEVDWEAEHGRQRRARMAAERICRQVIGDALHWKNEVERLSKQLAHAPHGRFCMTQDSREADCDCWKAGL